MAKKSKEKRYFWLKLKEDWFSGTTEKYLKSLPAGDSLLITYLKIQLMSLKTEGFLKYTRLLPSAEEEIAMLIDEPVNNVRLLISVLIKTGAVERYDDNSLYLLSLQSLIGSEGSSADRVRRFRERQKLLQSNDKKLELDGSSYQEKLELNENSKSLQSNTDVTNEDKCENVEILKNQALEESCYNVTEMKQNCYGEKELEQELELEKELEQEQEEKLNKTKLNNVFNYINSCKSDSIQLFNQSKEEMQENARVYLVRNILKKLEILIEDEKILNVMTEDRKLDILIQYYVINEFSKSPYNFLLDKLNKENFYLKYKKAEKYMSKDTLEKFIGYLITCLQEELIK